MIIQLEPDILECEVKWALDSITMKMLVEVMEFQLSYLKSWKMMLWKCCTQLPANLENSAVATGLEKVSFHSKPKESNAKECSNYHTIALISHISKVIVKILQARLQQYVNRELPDVQAGFRKGRGTRDQIANIHWILEKAREFQKNTYFCFIEYAKAFDCVDHNKLWKILKEMGIPDHLIWLLITCMQVRKQQLEMDMEQLTGSKWEKEYVKAVYCHPAYLTSMQSTSWETLGWKKHKLESRLLA